MDNSFLVYNRKHNWNYKRTFSYSFKLLELSNFFVSFSIFFHSFSKYSLFILLLYFYQLFYLRKYKQINTLILTFLQFYNIKTKISQLWWTFLITFLLFIIPIIRYFIERKRKCAIWKWDECKFIINSNET